MRTCAWVSPCPCATAALGASATHLLRALWCPLLFSPATDACLEQVLKDVPWFQDRILTDISLGSLMLVVVLKTVQFNLTKLQVQGTHHG